MGSTEEGLNFHFVYPIAKLFQSCELDLYLLLMVRNSWKRLKFLWSLVDMVKFLCQLKSEVILLLIHCLIIYIFFIVFLFNTVIDCLEVQDRTGKILILYLL